METKRRTQTVTVNYTAYNVTDLIGGKETVDMINNNIDFWANYVAPVNNETAGQYEVTADSFWMEYHENMDTEYARTKDIRTLNKKIKQMREYNERIFTR